MEKNKNQIKNKTNLETKQINQTNQFTNKFKIMKKLFLLVAIAALGLASCSEENFDQVSQKDSNKIAFKTLVGKNNLKVTELVQAQFQDFWVSAYRTQGSAASVFGQTLIPYIDNLRVYWNGSAWVYDGSYYWPGTDYLNFFAHNAEGYLLPTTSITGYPTFTYTQDPASSKDIVVAMDTNKVQVGTNPVALQFKHALCQINFSLKGAEVGPEYQIKQIKLNARTQGTFTFKPIATSGITSNWSGQLNASDYIYYDALGSPTSISTTLTNFQTATNPIMIIPQNGELVTITVTYDFVNQGVVLVQDAVATVTLTGQQMNVGKKVRYNLTIPTPTSITGNRITFTGTVSDWSSELPVDVTTTAN